MITEAEFKKIKEAIEHILLLAKQDPARKNNPLLIARIFDQGTGLKYYLQKKADGSYCFPEEFLLKQDKEEEKLASEAFTQFILPRTIKETFDKLCHDFNATEEKEESVEEQFKKPIKKILHHVVSGLNESFKSYCESTLRIESAQMADYFLRAILNNYATRIRTSPTIRSSFQEVLAEIRQSQSPTVVVNAASPRAFSLGGSRTFLRPSLPLFRRQPVSVESELRAPRTR